VFYMNPRIEAQREAAPIEQTQQGTEAPQPGQPGAAGPSAEIPGQPVPAAPAGAGDIAAAQTLEAALAAGGRVQIDTPRVSGSINLTGARLDDLVLKDYRESVDDDSQQIRLLAPAAMPD